MANRGDIGTPPHLWRPSLGNSRLNIHLDLLHIGWQRSHKLITLRTSRQTTSREDMAIRNDGYASGLQGMFSECASDPANICHFQKNKVTQQRKTSSFYRRSGIIGGTFLELTGRKGSFAPPHKPPLGGHKFWGHFFWNFNSLVSISSSAENVLPLQKIKNDVWRKHFGHKL